MTQCCHRTRLTFEASYPVLIPSKLRWQYLERDPSLQTGVLRQVDHSHTTCAKLCQDAILRQRLPDHVRNNSPLVRHAMPQPGASQCGEPQNSRLGETLSVIKV